MRAAAKSIDDYERLRKAIRAAAPKAVECIAYHVPAYRLKGKFLLAFGAAANHCSFYPGAAPIPAALIRKLVKSRVDEMSD